MRLRWRDMALSDASASDARKRSSAASTMEDFLAPGAAAAVSRRLATSSGRRTLILRFMPEPLSKRAILPLAARVHRASCRSRPHAGEFVRWQAGDRALQERIQTVRALSPVRLAARFPAGR